MGCYAAAMERPRKRAIAQTATSVSLAPAGETPRIVVPLTADDEGAAARELVQYIARYQADSKAMIRAGQSMAYGVRMIWFHAAGDKLVIHEPSGADADERVPGARTAMQLWSAQAAECARWGSQFLPPRPNQLIAVSAGVEEGDPLEGIRYEAPAHMSGWYLSTDRYDGDVRSMRTVHAYHVVLARPDVARFLALEPGFHFRGSALGDADTPTEVGRSEDDDES
jgi:hypothetical protein